MKTQHKSFAEIMDVFGFRIVDQADACYRALELCTVYTVRWSRDSKTILRFQGERLPVVTHHAHGAPRCANRSTNSHQATARGAENGIAGHWLYRSNTEFESSQQRARRWVSDLMELIALAIQWNLLKA